VFIDGFMFLLDSEAIESALAGGDEKMRELRERRVWWGAVGRVLMYGGFCVCVFWGRGLGVVRLGTEQVLLVIKKR
jgi:hypothetical protein